MDLDPIGAALANWARWCRDTGDCEPAGYPPEWPMAKVWVSYKVMVTEDEWLEQNKPPIYEAGAVRVEEWVNQLEPWHKIAVRTHYIHYPDSLLGAWDLPREQLDLLRSRRVQRHIREGGGGHRVDVDEYHRLVGAAVAELRDALSLFTRGV